MAGSRGDRVPRKLMYGRVQEKTWPDREDLTDAERRDFSGLYSDPDPDPDFGAGEADVGLSDLAPDKDCPSSEDPRGDADEG